MIRSTARRTAAGEPGIVNTTVSVHQSADGAAEHGRGADLLKAEHAKQLAVAGQRLGDQRADGFERLIATAQPGAAGQQHGIDLRHRREVVPTAAASSPARRE